ncbi:MAG: hypothetical protein ABSH56_29455 [Bryobacteraceae bacterium]|jgi:hypothetical protein
MSRTIILCGLIYAGLSLVLSAAPRDSDLRQSGGTAVRNEQQLSSSHAQTGQASACYIREGAVVAETPACYANARPAFASSCSDGEITCYGTHNRTVCCGSRQRCCMNADGAPFCGTDRCPN